MSPINAHCVYKSKCNGAGNNLSLPAVPIVLVGNKKDLRFDEATRRELAKSKQEPVKTEDGRAMAEKIGAYAYLECSAKLNEGVREVFETATRAALQQKKKRGKFCNLLWGVGQARTVFEGTMQQYVDFFCYLNTTWGFFDLIFVLCAE